MKDDNWSWHRGYRLHMKLCHNRKTMFLCPHAVCKGPSWILTLYGTRRPTELKQVSVSWRTKLPALWLMKQLWTHLWASIDLVMWLASHWINLPANMQDICLLLRLDLRLEADMNPLADTHTRMGSLSMHCTEMKFEESDRGTVKVLCSCECGSYELRNIWGKWSENYVFLS